LLEAINRLIVTVKFRLYSIIQADKMISTLNGFLDLISRYNSGIVSNFEKPIYKLSFVNLNLITFDED